MVYLSCYNFFTYFANGIRLAIVSRCFLPSMIVTAQVGRQFLCMLSN
jgi:hypothetical protein